MFALARVGSMSFSCSAFLASGQQHADDVPEGIIPRHLGESGGALHGSQPVDHFAGSNVERTSQPEYVREADVPGSPFSTADIGPVEARDPRGLPARGLSPRGLHGHGAQTLEVLQGLPQTHSLVGVNPITLQTTGLTPKERAPQVGGREDSLRRYLGIHRAAVHRQVLGTVPRKRNTVLQLARRLPS